MAVPQVGGILTDEETEDQKSKWSKVGEERLEISPAQFQHDTVSHFSKEGRKHENSFIGKP